MKTLWTNGLRWLGTIAAMVVGLVSASAGPVRADANPSTAPIAAASDQSAHAALNVHFFHGLAADIRAAIYEQGEGQRAQLAAQIRPVDPAAVARFLGHYDSGWRVVLSDPETLRITHDQRASRLRALPDGSYVGIDGFLLATRVHFSTDEGGSRLMKIEGFDPGGVPPLQWLTGNRILHWPEPALGR
jgi:hypothetical protein